MRSLAVMRVHVLLGMVNKWMEVSRISYNSALEEAAASC